MKSNQKQSAQRVLKPSPDLCLEAYLSRFSTVLQDPVTNGMLRIIENTILHDPENPVGVLINPVQSMIDPPVFRIIRIPKNTILFDSHNQVPLLIDPAG